MNEIDKLLRGWHGCVSFQLRKPRYRVSLMRTDEHWFEGEGQTAKAAINRAVRAAGGNPKSKTKCPRKECTLCEG